MRLDLGIIDLAVFCCSKQMLVDCFKILPKDVQEKLGSRCMTGIDTEPLPRFEAFDMCSFCLL